MRKLRKILIYGDSISTVNHGEGGYEGRLRKYFSAEVINYAVGSSGLSLPTPNNAVSILADHNNIPEDADLIIMWHGSNDWYWGSPIGTLGDKDSYTFLGAIEEAVHKIRRASPEAVLVWLNPIFRYEMPDQGCVSGSAYETKNKIGRTLTDYCQALTQASVYYGFPVLDLRRLCGIHEYNHNLFLEDGVHPNKAGYDRIFRIMKRGLETVLDDMGVSYVCNRY